MKQSLSRLARLRVDRILPGHGEPVNSGGSNVIAKLAKAGVKPVDEDDDSLIGKPV